MVLAVLGDLEDVPNRCGNAYLRLEGCVSLMEHSVFVKEIYRFRFFKKFHFL